MIDVLRENFILEVSYVHDTVYSCSESGCDLEGICRCAEILNPVVTKVDVHMIVNKIFKYFFDKSKETKRNTKINEILYGISEEIEKYTLDRILRCNKIWNPHKWEIKVGSGYYGQEVEDITLRLDVVEKIEKEIENAFETQSLKDRIEYLLKLENGWILSDLKNYDYEVVTIDRDDLIFGNDGHKNKVLRMDLSFYDDSKYTGIRGVVIKNKNKWKIIDGYHRLSKTEMPKVKVISCVKHCL